MCEHFSVPETSSSKSKKSTLRREARHLAEAILEGRSAARLDPSGLEGEDHDTVVLLNKALDHLTRHAGALGPAETGHVADRLERLAAGELEPVGPTIVASAEAARIESAFALLSANLAHLVRRFEELDAAHRAGDYEHRIDPSGFDGIYRRIVDAAHRTVEGQVGKVLGLVKTVGQVADGNVLFMVERLGAQDLEPRTTATNKMWRRRVA